MKFILSCGHPGIVKLWVLGIFGCALFADITVIAHELILTNFRDRPNIKLLWIPFDTRSFSRLEENPAQTLANLQMVVRLNPWDTANSLQLSAELEASGQTGAAEQAIIQAATHDAGQAPKWALANFYLRHGQQNQFFLWANRYRSLAQTPSKGMLRLALDAGESLEDSLRQLGPLSCKELATLLILIDERGTPSDSLLDRMTACSDGESKSKWSEHISRILEKDEPTIARSQWHQLGLDDTLYNDNFHEPLTEQGFDWRINRYPDIDIEQSADMGGLQVICKPSAVDGSIIVFEPVVLKAGRAYRLNIATTSPSDQDSIDAEILELVGGRVILPSLRTFDDGLTHAGTTIFVAPTSTKTLVLALVYRKAAGSNVEARSLAVSSVRLEPVFSSM